MLTQEQINPIISEISLIKAKAGETNEMRLAIVNAIALKLNAKYVEIYFVDPPKTLALRHAGSGDIGKILDKHLSPHNLRVHSEFTAQVGPVIVLGEARVIDWETGEIISYTLPPNFKQFDAKVIANSPPLFFSPELSSEQEVYLPIRSSNENIGALVLYFDEQMISSTKDILLLQTIADFIGGFVK